MKPTFFARTALAILIVTFFLIPFGVRGARMSLERMKNDVKDWLPSDFKETVELDWFRRHFLGEQFILISWPTCTGEPDDEQFKTFVAKLKAESRNEEIPEETDPFNAYDDPQLEDLRARQLGDKYGLFLSADPEHSFNAAGLEEKWLMGEDDHWYYITPAGELFRWHGRGNALGAIVRGFQRLVTGKIPGEGTMVAIVGANLNDNVNRYYAEPRRLTARVFKTLMSGPDQLAEIAKEGGATWPRELDPEHAPEEARRRALERLTGTLFGPEMPYNFRWTAEDFGRLVAERKKQELGNDWRKNFERFTEELVAERYGGDLSALRAAPRSEQTEHWDAFFASQGVKPPARRTCVVVTLSDVGKRHMVRVVGREMLGQPLGRVQTLARESGIPVEDIHMGGPPVDNVAIDEEGRITLVRLVGFAALVGLSLSYLCLRSLKVTMMVFMVGGLSAVSSLSIVWWTGSSVDAVLMSMPALVYVLGLSGAVHIVNYYRDAVIEDGVEGACETAVNHGWKPCTLAAVTTAIGLLSLPLSSNIIPIAKFGLFSALGVLATLIMLFTLLPSLLQLWPPGYERSTAADPNRKGMFDGLLNAFWERFGGLVMARPNMVAFVCAVVMLTIGWGCWDIHTSVQLLKLFDAEAKIIKDYAWLESNIGKLVPMELVVRVERELVRNTREETVKEQAEPLGIAPPAAPANPSKFQYSFLERMELAERVQKVVEEQFGERGQDLVGRGMSAVTFAPTLPGSGAGLQKTAERGAYNRRLEDHAKGYVDSDFLRLSGDPTRPGELWRISLRLAALGNTDYGQFVNQIKEAVEPVMTACHWRQEILTQLDDHKREAKEAALRAAGEPVDEERLRKEVHSRNARVLVLGAPAETPPPGEGEEPAEEEVGQSVGHGVSLAAQTKIFSDTLRDLLKNAAIRYGSHDPVAQPFQEGYRNSEEWAKALQAMDCVVLLTEHPHYDLEFIRQHAPLVIDARAHQFQPGNSEPLVGQTANERGAPVSVVYTGVVPVVYKAQRTLLDSLINSVISAFGLIAIVMMLLFRGGKSWTTRYINVPGGLVSMFPNLFPVLTVFGLMGHMQVLVDIGTMMCASVALGVAVDDTIHFLTWFRWGLNEGMTRRDAIMNCYRRVGTAMLQTTLIGGVGLSVFALSTFTPTQRFGVMMLTLLCAALVGDLIFLPAILAGPLGRFFAPANKKRRKPSAATPAAAASPGGNSAAEAEGAAAEGLATAQPGSAAPHAGAGGGGGGTPHASLRQERDDSRIRRRDGGHGAP